MVRLTLPSYLFNLLPQEEKTQCSSRRSVNLAPGSWEEVAHEIRDRFPQLAERVLREPAGIAPGFAIIVNDTILPKGKPSVEFRNGDVVAVIAAMAGG